MDQPLDYHKTIAFEGQAERALKIARGGFGRCSFLFVEDGPEGFMATGPGLHNSRHNPLYAVSWVRVRVTGGQIELEARFGGLRTIKRFLFGVMLAFLIIFMLSFGTATDKSFMERIIKPNLTLASGLLIFPWMLYALRRNTIRNLDRMADNMVALGKTPEGQNLPKPEREGR